LPFLALVFFSPTSFPAHPSATLATFGMEGDTTEDVPKDSTFPNSTANNLLRDLLYRRKHYETNCCHIAARRDDLYKEISINYLLSLAFHTTPTLLENFYDIDAVI
jgi:hypothetical protein